MSPVAIQYVIMALQALPALIAAGAELGTETQALIAQIKVFADEKRDPNPAEWAQMNAGLIAAMTGLQAAKPAL